MSTVTTTVEMQMAALDRNVTISGNGQVSIVFGVQKRMRFPEGDEIKPSELADAILQAEFEMAASAPSAGGDE